MKIWGMLFTLCAAVSIAFLQGCGVIHQTVYLQDVNISGPMNQPPLHITNNSGSSIFSISPKVFINTAKNPYGRVDGHSKVNKDGKYQVDTIYNNEGSWAFGESKNNTFDYNGNNFNWSLPDAVFGADIDLNVSKAFSFYGGITYSTGDQQSLFGGNVGIGIHSQHENFGSRFDFGLLWQDLSYDISSAVVYKYAPLFGSEDQSVLFYRDKGKFTSYNFYGEWTLNSVNSKLPFDYYAGAGVVGQTIVDYTPRQIDFTYTWPGALNTPDETKTITSTYLMLMLGVYENLNENNRISLGVRMLKEINFPNLSQYTYFYPLIQWDMSF